MLSIHKVSSSAQAAHYFSQADYYTKGENGVDIGSSWAGKGADSFGLHGEVDPDKFKTLLNGLTPDGQALFKVEDGDKKHTPAWDLTFSAPKSLSILALMGGDERLLNAHHESVQKALEKLEKDFFKGRKTTDFGVVPIQLKNMIVAQFTHTTSRDIDPQLHTHNVVMNMGWNEDGKARSLDSKAFYRFSMELGLLYRNELALATKALGYDINIEKDTGFFEIDGIDKNTIKHFSTRREEIEKLAKERGYQSAKEFDKAAVQSRQSKQNKSKEYVINFWDSKAKEIGFDPKPIIDKSKSQKYGNSKPFSHFTDAKHLMEYAVKVKTQREANVPKTEIYQLAYKDGLGQFSSEQLDVAYHQLVKEKVIIESNIHSELLTTKEAARREQYTLSLMEKGKNKLNEIAPEESIKAVINKRTLRLDQELALIKLVKNKDFVVGLQGYAGVGKTYMLSAYIEVLNKNGYSVKGFSQTGEAAQILQNETGLESNTIASLLMKNKIESKQNKPLENQHGKEVWVIDEASLVNSKDMADLLTDARRRGVRVVLSGDYAQLNSIDAGKPFHQLIHNGMAYGDVNQIIRQNKNPNLKNAIYELLDSKTIKAFNRLEKHFVTGSNLEDLAARQYLDLSKAERDNTLLIVPENQARDNVNKIVRDGLKRKGELDAKETDVKLYTPSNMEDERKKYSFNYSKGAYVRFHNAYKTIGVEKDGYYEILGRDGEFVLINVNGKTVRWNPTKVAGGAKFGVTEYQVKQDKIAKNDKIVWKDKNKELNLKNGSTGIVELIDGHFAKVRFKDGELRTIDLNKESHRHFEHNYVSTVYAAQGHTYQNTIAIAESWRRNLINRAAFYVAISRTKNNLTLLTDSSSQLKKAVDERLGLNSSSLDILNELQKQQLKNEIHQRQKENIFSLHKALGFEQVSRVKTTETNKQVTNKSELDFVNTSKKQHLP